MVASAGNKISTQTGIGTIIAIAGVAMYSLIKANMEEQKRVIIYPLLHNFSIHAVGTWLCSMAELEFWFRRVVLSQRIIKCNMCYICLSTKRWWQQSPSHSCTGWDLERSANRLLSFGNFQGLLTFLNKGCNDSTSELAAFMTRVPAGLTCVLSFSPSNSQ